MRTAVVLLILLGLAAIPGSVLPQRNVASDPNAVLRFQQQNPDLAPWLDRLGLFDVYASSWFAAVYILLLVSMTGCVLPRSRRLLDNVRADPPRAPQRWDRMEQRRTVTRVDQGDALGGLATELRRRGFRVRQDADGGVRAERGYLREAGNLVFHLSLLVLLLGIGVGRLFGFEGRVAVVEGAGFTNVLAAYDEFNPRALTDIDGLEPFSLNLTDFDVSFEAAGPNRGQPSSFRADVSYTRPGGTPQDARIQPNAPLDVDGTKVFLTGQGYAPRVTVRDGADAVVFSGPVVFLPIDATYVSDGVIKAPDALPAELGFEGLFLPTAAMAPETGPYSAFPDLLRPRLLLTAFAGDLNMEGAPQSVYTLDKSRLDQVERDGQPVAQLLAAGETMRLPDGLGSITFDGVDRFANFQIAYDPGKYISLAASVLLLAGLTMSLAIRRRRIWARWVAGPASGVELASVSLSRREADPEELDELASFITHHGQTGPMTERQ